MKKCNKSRRKKIKLEGSFTIELSLVVSVVFMSIIIILFLGIYLHDCIVIRSIGNGAITVGNQALNGVDKYNERIENGIYLSNINEEAYNRMRQYILNNHKKLLLGKGNVNQNFEYYIEIKNNVLYQKVLVELRQNISSESIRKIVSIIRNDGEDFITSISSANVYTRTDLVRNISFFDDISSSIEVLNNQKVAYYKRVNDVKKLVKDLMKIQ